MRYWHIRKYKDKWYAWDVLSQVEGPLNLKDAIYHSSSIKELLFYLEAQSEDTWKDRGMTINNDFDLFNGRYIPIKE